MANLKAQLIIKKDGQTVETLTLQQDREYIAGRAKASDIRLDVSTVSRQHFKIFYKDSSWQIQTLSKYSPIYLNNEPIDFSQLKSSDTIKVANYVFLYTTDAIQSAEPIEKTIQLDASLSEEVTPASGSPSAFEMEDTSDAIIYDDNVPVEDEKTFVPEMTSEEWTIGIPYLIVRSPNHANKTLRLEGDYWVLGRDEGCDIVIEDVKSSREHCEIYKKNGSYFVLDKDSSNGTLFNGSKMSYKKEYSLKSGDNIQIGQHTLTFEIRDPHFQEKLSLIPLGDQGSSFDGSYHSPATSGMPSGQKVIKIEPVRNKKLFAYGLGGALALILAYNLGSGLNSESKQEMSSSTAQNISPELTNPYDSLAEDQKEYINKSFKLGQTLFKEGKYELALIEVEKIHALVPEYKDSKSIQKYSKAAINTLMEQNEISRQEQEQSLLGARVALMIDDCEMKYKNSLDSGNLDQCLSAIEDLDPENVRINQLKMLADQNEAKKDAVAAQKASYRNRVSQRRQLFERAVVLVRKGKVLDAISAHNRNIASTLPDPENLEKKSKQEVDALQKKIQEDLKKYAAEAEQAYNQKNYRAAIKKLEDAIRLNPQDRFIKDTHAQYSKELYNQVKALYGDSVLEENLGNIDSAKEKWRKIHAMDMEYGEYYKKANSKLKKYGS